MSYRERNSENLTGAAFAQLIGTSPEKELNSYTPGEICYLAEHICNTPPSALPCKGQRTERIKQGMAEGKYALMAPFIARAVVKTRAHVSMSDCDATGAVSRDVMVSIIPKQQGYSRVYDVDTSKVDMYEHMLKHSTYELPQSAEQSSVWSGGVRITSDDTSHDRATRRINSVINSLVRYKDDGTVESNCTSDSKYLAPYKLTTASQAVVGMLKKSSKTVVKDFVYHASKDHVQVQERLWDTVSVTLGSKLKNTVLTQPDGEKHAEWTGKEVSSPKVFAIKDPISAMAGIAPAVNEKRIGLMSVSQINGLPVTKEVRTVMNLCDDVDVPADVQVIRLASGNRNQSEYLWRRQGCPNNLVVMYPHASTYNALEYGRYISNGQVKRGGVVAYHPNDLWKECELVVLHVDLSLSCAATSKKKQIGETCKASLVTLKERLGRTQGAKYVCCYAHAYIGHQSFWLKKTKVNADAETDGEQTKYVGLAHLFELGGMYDVGKAKEESKYFCYASARYARQNCVVTNYDRIGLDPIPVQRLPFVVVNLMMWHAIHPVLRHVVLDFKDKVKGKSVTYRMFRALRFYPLGDGRMSELMSVIDCDLADCFKGAMSGSILPSKLFEGKKNPDYVRAPDEQSDEEVDDDESLDMDQFNLDEDVESEDEDVDPFGGVVVKDVTLGQMVG